MPYFEPSRPMPDSFMPPRGRSRQWIWRDDAFVDADDAVFERRDGAPDTADVTTVEIGGEPEFGVVGHLDRFVIGLGSGKAAPPGRRSPPW